MAIVDLYNRIAAVQDTMSIHRDTMSHKSVQGDPSALARGGIAPCTHGTWGRQVAGLVASLSCAFSTLLLSFLFSCVASPLREAVLSERPNLARLRAAVSKHG